MELSSSGRTLTDERTRLVPPGPPPNLLSILIIPSPTREYRSPALLRGDLHILRRTFRGRIVLYPLHLCEDLLVEVEGEGVVVPSSLCGGWEELEEKREEERFAGT